MITAPVFGAYNISNGLDANKPKYPKVGDMYIATDTKLTYVCYEKVGFDISTAVFSQSINTQDSNPAGLAFNGDGSKMYEIGTGGDKIYEYVLSTPFDISTAVFSQSINTQDANPRGLTFNDTGLKMYEIGFDEDKIYEYVLSTPFDISTAVLSQSINTQGDASRDLAFNSTGLKMYEIDAGEDKIYEYVLSTPFDISTAVLSQSTNTQDSGPSGLAFNGDGSKMYYVGYGGKKIYEYVLSTPFDISTAVFSQSINTQDSNPTGLAFNGDGSKMYEIGEDGAKIYEYSIQPVGKWELMVEEIIANGNDADKPLSPKVGDMYIATDTHTTYVCYENVWERAGEIKNEIRMYAGTVETIPVGWVLCDGENGTPDLRNRFIVGAGDKYKYQDVGGEDSHTLTIDEMPRHSHSYITSGGTTNQQSNIKKELSYPAQSYTSEVGGGVAHENRPPYYALCFIMRV